MSEAISLTKDARKPHRASKSGAKAAKKRDKAGKVRTEERSSVLP